MKKLVTISSLAILGGFGLVINCAYAEPPQMNENGEIRLMAGETTAVDSKVAESLKSQDNKGEDIDVESVIKQLKALKKRIKNLEDKLKTADDKFAKKSHTHYEYGKKDHTHREYADDHHTHREYADEYHTHHGRLQ